jgi:hypothetical protein
MLGSLKVLMSPMPRTLAHPPGESYRELPSDETPGTDLESDTFYSTSIGSGEELVAENGQNPLNLGKSGTNVKPETTTG